MQGGIFLCQAQNLTSKDWEKDVEPKRGNRRLNQDTRAGKAHLAQGSRGKRQIGDLELPPLSSLGPNSPYEGLKLNPTLHPRPQQPSK